MASESMDLEKKNKETAYILWACGLLMVHGLHRFYLGKIGTGLLWFFTLGLFGVGWLVDMITLGNQVETANLKRQALLASGSSQPLTHIYHVHSSQQEDAELKEKVSEIDDPAQVLDALTKRLRKIDRLFMNEFLTDEEYARQKNAILKEMTIVIDEEYPEDGLMLFAQLKEEGVIDERDFKRVKSVLLS